MPRYLNVFVGAGRGNLICSLYGSGAVAPKKESGEKK